MASINCFLNVTIINKAHDIWIHFYFKFIFFTVRKTNLVMREGARVFVCLCEHLIIVKEQHSLDPKK